MPIYKAFPSNKLTLKTYRVPTNLVGATALFNNYAGGKPFVIERNARNAHFLIQRSSVQSYSRQPFRYTTRIDIAGVAEPLNGVLAIGINFATYRLEASALNPPDRIFLKEIVGIMGLQIAAVPLRGMTEADYQATIPAVQRLAALNPASADMLELRSTISRLLKDYNILIHYTDLPARNRMDSHLPFFHFTNEDLQGPVTKSQQEAYNLIKSYFI